jgi:DNA-binding CsgD family transcriptional regulator
VRVVNADEAGRRVAKLSRRQVEIFDLTVHGHDHDAIARKLEISPKTVLTHRAHIMVKLDIHGVSDMVRLAFLVGKLEAGKLVFRG